MSHLMTKILNSQTTNYVISQGNAIQVMAKTRDLIQ